MSTLHHNFPNYYIGSSLTNTNTKSKTLKHLPPWLPSNTNRSTDLWCTQLTGLFIMISSDIFFLLIRDWYLIFRVFTKDILKVTSNYYKQLHISFQRKNYSVAYLKFEEDISNRILFSVEL